MCMLRKKVVLKHEVYNLMTHLVHDGLKLNNLNKSWAAQTQKF